MDLQCLFLLQIPRGFFIQWSSYCRFAERYRPSLRLGLSTDQRITDGMEASRCILDANVIIRVHSEQLHGHVRRSLCSWSDYRFRHVFIVSPYLQGPREWPKN